MNNYKAFSIDLARSAGEIIRDNFSLGMKKEWKENNTPLTVTDTQINSLVIKKIKESFPDHSILGEEGSSLQESDYMWVCDPIDGTLSFSHGIPISTFSLALTQKGISILGVVYDPFMDRLFFAEKGKGAFLNDNPIHVSTKGNLATAVVDIEAQRPSQYNLDALRIALDKKSVVLMSLRAAIYAGMLIAAGATDGLLFAYDTVWDAAATKVIVEEAGGICTDMQGNDQRYDKPMHGFIASNGAIHSQLVEMSKQFATNVF